MENVTKIEKEVIQNILNSEYMDAKDERIIDWPVWSFSATNSTKRLAGALGSLAKKGLVECEDDVDGETCALTRKGFEWAKENGLITLSKTR